MKLQECYKKLPMESGIYMITNTRTNRSYIGFAKVMKDRLHSHVYNLKRNENCNIFLRQDWLEDDSTFDVCVLELTSDPDREQYYIELYKTNTEGYNIFIGRVPSEEVKDKIRKSRIGTHFSESHRNRLSESHIGKPSPKGMLGKKHSLETKQKMSLSHKKLRMEDF